MIPAGVLLVAFRSRPTARWRTREQLNAAQNDNSRLSFVRSDPFTFLTPFFDWNVFAKEEEKMKRKKLARLQTLAASLNYQLTPLT